MSRWKVRREWRDTLDGYSWVALRPSGLYGDVFPTWREAMDYADRMARTREVVLPRPDSTWFERPVWELGDGVTVHQSIADQNKTITADYPRMSIPNHKRREFALAILALEEQEVLAGGSE